MSFVQRKLNQEALRKLVEKGGVPFKQNARSYIFSCPKCAKQKLYVQKSDGRSQCMHCAKDLSGWADYVLSLVYSRTRQNLAELLYGASKLGTADIFQDEELPDFWHEFETDEIEIQQVSLPPPIEWDPDYVDLTHPLASKGLEYLIGRGIPVAIAQKYGVRYNPREARVVFPVKIDGILRGWQGRIIGPSEIYLESESRTIYLPRLKTEGAVGGRCLMFQDNLKGSEHGVLVEGPVDCIKCDLIGGNVASMGKSYTAKQLDILLSSGIKKLYVGLDDDAVEDTLRIAHDVGSKLDLYRLETPPGREDLGASTPEEAYEQFKTAKKLDNFYISGYLEMPKFF